MQQETCEKKNKEKITTSKRKKSLKRAKKDKPKMKYYGKTPTTLTCKNITCLSDLLQVLKIDKDTVQHFIQQKRRLDARLRLAEKKREKSDDFETTRDYLVSSLGGGRALANDSPICAGKVNTTRARNVRQKQFKERK